ncbi:hypothetical protein LSTR_LSTR014078 [Laodelphax striatellus]|uniref:Uncharacterized protein n=1 Tax=Laodelphax striatellus TaxID=195883 RepID=A0A482XCZ6_LAOST|nr:hypothetical protein LSTR_LSTR014078 [Laodelphax striatellus]
MHELFTQVLSNKDLSKAGDLFSVADSAIVDDLTEVVETIAEITALPDYVNNDNDQSVVEIIITRVTSAIRETGSIERHAEALVALLESCLSHNLKPSTKDEDPPHAKISSDIISCIFLDEIEGKENGYNRYGTRDRIYFELNINIGLNIAL